MTRAEKIAELDRRLSDELLDDVLAMARHRQEPHAVFETLDPEHQAEILENKARAESGEGLIDGPAGLADIRTKLKSTHGV